MTDDRAIDRFLDAVEAAGLPRPAAPDGDTAAALRELEGAIAPLRLPAAARRLWERVDADALGLELVPDLCSPTFALDAWRAHERQPGMVPRPLLPLCYSSWVFLFVELHGETDEEGGAIFGWEYGGGNFELVFDDVAEWLELLSEALAADGAEPGPDGLQLRLDDAPPHDGAARLARRGPHPRHGATTAFSDDAFAWPQRWLRLSGLTDDDRLPQGATHTIAEARPALDGGAGPGSAPIRVHARVTHVDGDGEETRAAIRDDSGALLVACPPQASAFGPVRGERFELELVGAGERGSSGPFARAARRLRPASGPPQATARAIRPLDRRS